MSAQLNGTMYDIRPPPNLVSVVYASVSHISHAFPIIFTNSLFIFREITFPEAIPISSTFDR